MHIFSRNADFPWGQADQNYFLWSNISDVTARGGLAVTEGENPPRSYMVKTYTKRKKFLNMETLWKMTLQQNGNNGNIVEKTEEQPDHGGAQ